MYTYKLVNNDEFEIAYRNHISKNLLKGSLILIGIINLLMFVLSYSYLTIAFKTKMFFFVFAFVIMIILEFLIFFISYKNEIKKILNIVPDDAVNISFDKEGITIKNDYILRHIKWKAVSKVVVDKNNLLFHYNITGMPGDFIYLKFFDAESEEVIKDIEKYIKVRKV
ncbi:hypothetical protein R0131_18385 [Clostridium sp. AL.422]|uniref:hypothetical protein n=1 Tax=Clostridium TaxID=1485 RepID=UPI00293DF531|nr:MULTISPECIES: hypothetical protein [unclassified Clostridium]MDV4152798.1 hypothetical protein [Clostridium sp. AL.422]